MGFVIGWVLVVLFFWLMRSRKPKSPVPAWTLPALTSEMDRVERLLLQGDAGHSTESLAQMESSVMTLQGPGGLIPRVRFRLLAADLLAWTGRPDQARQQLEQAVSDLDGPVEPHRGLELRTRAEASRALLIGGLPPDRDLIAAGMRALDCETRVSGPDVLMRLAWTAHRLAGVEHLQGRWSPARTLFERSVAIGQRMEQPVAIAADDAWGAEMRELLWSHGRKVASEAARDLGLVLGSLGDREGTMHWLDQAISLVEGAKLPPARLRLARALIERAGNEPVDAFTGIGRHEAMLQRAVDEGLACGTVEGKTAACVAQVAWANLYEPPRPPEKRLEHLRRAMELTGGLEEPAAGYNVTYLQLALGVTLEEHGERAAAIDALRKAVERGATHPDPDARKLAAQAAYRLHQMLIADGSPADARAQVAVIEELVPSLPPEARTTFAGIAAHSRGMQHHAEDRPEEARRSLEQAEALARQAGAFQLVRSAAADLGRLALRTGRPADAEPHLRRALETQVPGESAGDEHARRAEILWLLSDTHMMMERPEQALRECRRAFDLGRSAGNAAGREVAAVMAFRLGDAADGEPSEGRRYFQTAAQLGRLSGRPRGREAAEEADARLRDMGL